MALEGEQTGRVPGCKPLQTTSFQGALGTFTSLRCDKGGTFAVWWRLLQEFNGTRCFCACVQDKLKSKGKQNENLVSVKQDQMMADTILSFFSQEKQNTTHKSSFSNHHHQWTADFHAHTGAQPCTPDDLVVLQCSSLHGDVPEVLAVTDWSFQGPLRFEIRKKKRINFAAGHQCYLSKKRKCYTKSVSSCSQNLAMQILAY